MVQGCLLLRKVIFDTRALKSYYLVALATKGESRRVKAIHCTTVYWHARSSTCIGSVRGSNSTVGRSGLAAAVEAISRIAG